MSPAPTERDRRAVAFEHHVVPEMEVLLRVARTLVGRPADAEDLVQETLVRAYRGIEGFDGRHARAWLLTIMRNAEINRHRRQRPQLLDDPATELERLTTEADARSGPEGIVVDTEFDAVVTHALAALPERFRRVVELVDVSGLTYAEAAQLLDIPVGTVMSRLHRARSKMRDRLTAAGLTPRRGA